MTSRGKSIEELRAELELIDRTIRALENLGRLRLEIPGPQAVAQRRTAHPDETAVRVRKPVQTQ
jgi:hypothetical protein